MTFAQGFATNLSLQDRSKRYYRETRDFHDGLRELYSGGEHGSEGACPAMIGYARVSSEDRTPDPQRATAPAAVCKPVFKEKAPGAQHTRPELVKMPDHWLSGNVAPVRRPDLLARSTRDLPAMADPIGLPAPETSHPSPPRFRFAVDECGTVS